MVVRGQVGFSAFSDATILALRFTSASVAKQLLTLWGCGVNAGAAAVLPHCFVHCSAGFNATRTQ